jgi:hypothetical protein
LFVLSTTYSNPDVFHQKTLLQNMFQMGKQETSTLFVFFCCFLLGHVLHQTILWTSFTLRCHFTLDSIHGLGFFHFNAKRKGGITYSALDLSTHLVRIPHLFSGLAKSLLQLSIGSGAGFSLDLIPRVSDALCAMIVCDPQGYISLVQSLLSAQVNTFSNTLGDEKGGGRGGGESLSSQLQHAFDTLTSELFSLFQSFTNNAPVSIIGNIATSTSLSISKGGGGGGGMLQQQRHPLDRLSKNAFRKRFEVFVIAVRGLTVVI